MSSAVFGGQVIVQSGEGGYRYQPGVPGTDVKIGRPARGRRRYVKDLGSSQTEHVLEVVYEVPTSSLQTIINRLSNISAGRIGSLSVTGFPSVGRCAVAATPVLTPAKRTATGYYFSTTITFVEL